MNSQDIFIELASLGLPPNEYVVVGGAALAARQIRDTLDIDLVVTPRLFAELKKDGWTFKTRPNGKPGLHRGHFEAYLDVNCGDFEPSTTWLLANAEIIEGVHVVDLKTLARLKKNYGREKDLKDLVLIAAHFSGKD